MTDVDDTFRAERTQSTFSLTALWPDPQPHFAPIAIPQELFVPVQDHLVVLSGGVEAGGSLTQKRVEGRSAALAPCAGVIDSSTAITLLNGNESNAAVLRTTAGAPPKRKASRQC